MQDQKPKESRNQDTIELPPDEQKDTIFNDLKKDSQDTSKVIPTPLSQNDRDTVSPPNMSPTPSREKLIIQGKHSVDSNGQVTGRPPADLESFRRNSLSPRRKSSKIGSVKPVEQKKSIRQAIEIKKNEPMHKRVFDYFTKRRPVIFHSRVAGLDDRMKYLIFFHTCLTYPRLVCVCLYWSGIKDITYPKRTWCPDQLTPALFVSSEVICMAPSVIYTFLLLKRITHKDIKETQNSDKIHILTWFYLLVGIVTQFLCNLNLKYDANALGVIHWNTLMAYKWSEYDLEKKLDVLRIVSIIFHILSLIPRLATAFIYPSGDYGPLSMQCFFPTKYKVMRKMLGDDKDTQTKSLIVSTDDYFTMDVVFGWRMQKNIDEQDARMEAVLNLKFCLYKVLLQNLPQIIIQSAMLPLLTQLDTRVGCAERENIPKAPVEQVRSAIDMNIFIMIFSIFYTIFFQLTWKKKHFKNIDTIIENDIEEESVLREDGSKQFMLTVPEANPSFLRKLFIGASVQNVEHMIIDGVHMTEPLQEWEDDFVDLEEIQDQFNFKSLIIKNATFDAPDAIFMILNSFPATMDVKVRTGALNLSINDNGGREIEIKGTEQNPVDFRFLIDTACKTNITQLRFVDTHFQGNAQEWDINFEISDLSVKKLIQSIDMRMCTFMDARFVTALMNYLPQLTGLYLPDDLLAENGDAYNIHIIENDSLIKNKKLFGYKPLEADPFYMQKIIDDATDRDVTHLRFQYTHFNGKVEEWEKVLDSEHIQSGSSLISRINTSIKYLDISECTFEDTNFIWPLMKSLVELSHLKSEKLKLILRKDNTMEFTMEVAQAGPKFVLKTINEANRKKISRLKFLRTHFKGTAEEWREVFEASTPKRKRYLTFFDFSTCSFEDADFIESIKIHQPKMKILYNPSVNNLERMQSEEFMKMFFKLKIVKQNELKLIYKSRFNAKSFFFLIMQTSRVGVREIAFMGVKKLDDYVDPDFYSWDGEFEKFQSAYKDDPCQIEDIQFKGYQPVQVYAHVLRAMPNLKKFGLISQMALKTFVQACELVKAENGINTSRIETYYLTFG